MKREIIITADGSSSIRLPEWNETYHSKHGAIQEAYHVFMQMGLFYFKEKFPGRKRVSILEIGFGTGLNALISFLESYKLSLQIEYNAVEAFPISSKEVLNLNYSEYFPEAEKIFQEMHRLPWKKNFALSENFQLFKQKKLFQEINEVASYDLIFFDAFGPQVQPELWSEEIFKKMFAALIPDGILTTYSAKGSVRRAMQAAGFAVEKLPGPPGKREMLRAMKPL